MKTGKSDVTYKGLAFVLEYVIFETIAEALIAICRLPEDTAKKIEKVLQPFNSLLGAALREINNHVRHRATQGKKQVLRDAYKAHQQKVCASLPDGEPTGCGKKPEDCAAIQSAILLNQEFSRDHIPPSGKRSKGPVTVAVAKDIGMAAATDLPADLLDKVTRGEISLRDAYLSLQN
ncbi:MAG: hypothetical protein ACYSW3_28280 [Planctomycetota bacterium]|jgi:hypothetical protein